MFISTKTYGHDLGLSCAFRQWRADSHCRHLHGYALAIHLEFEADELDVRNWVVDFGSLKSFKQQLVDTFDHKTLVAKDDPAYSCFEDLHRKGIIQMVDVPATGCEAFARLIFECADLWLRDAGYTPRVRVHAVEVREHGANSARFAVQTPTGLVVGPADRSCFREITP
jgi:6-pyruvoyltetrahydropterin/6-carboxytetrahydropterin synthase